MISQIITKLENTAGSNAKIDILKNNQSNTILKTCFELALHPHLNFYIKKIPAVKSHQGVISLAEALVRLEKLSSREFTGHAARDYVADTLSKLSKEDSDVLTRVLKRDMKCGVSVATVNKIWEDLIATYAYMRCCLPKDSNIKKWDWKKGVYIQTKMDGMFCNAIVHDGKTEILSRAGSPFPTEFAERIRSDLLAVSEFSEKVIHGELVVLDKKSKKYLDRKTGNGMLNSCLQEGEFDYEKYDIRLVAWDIIPYDNWINAIDYTVKYSTRFTEFRAALATNNTQNIISVKTVVVFSTAEALEVYYQLLDEGEEGGVMKSPDMIWSNGTSKDQVKMKMIFEFDLKIIKLNPGTGKNAKTFGSIEAASLDDLLTVNMSGFKDAEREYLHSIRDQLPGMIVTGKSNALIQRRGSTKWSMFLPRFVELRLDKTIADDLNKIIETADAAKKTIFGGADE